MRRVTPAFLCIMAVSMLAGPATAGTLTPHLISFQGQALDDAEQPLATGFTENEIPRPVKRVMADIYRTRLNYVY